MSDEKILPFPADRVVYVQPPLEPLQPIPHSVRLRSRGDWLHPELPEEPLPEPIDLETERAKRKPSDFFKPGI